MVSSLRRRCQKMFSKEGSEMRSLVLLPLFALVVSTGLSEVRLPRLVSDGMVLQRDANVRIWGWAAPEEAVSVGFCERRYDAVADRNGRWEVDLSHLKPGGPFVMRIDGSNSIAINDIVVGDVWVCSGQSNMQMALGWLGVVYQSEIDSAENPFIRQFLVPMGVNFTGHETDFKSGAWQKATPTNVRNFTAIGYFFAKK
jgi:sialate O-acetylesterase